MKTINDIIGEAISQAGESGQNASYLAERVVRSLSRDELVQVAADINNNRFKSYVGRLSTGIHNRSGRTLTEEEMVENEVNLRQLVLAKTHTEILAVK